MPPRTSLKIQLGLILFALSGTWAEKYNSKSLLIGDKAAALGGAFAGWADDATATYYNPAGLVQIKQAKLNVSAQIAQYQQQKIDIGLGKTLPYSSFNFTPTISAFSQRFGPAALGFSIVTPHNDLFRGGQSIAGPYADSENGLPHYGRIDLNYYDVSKANLLGPSLAFRLNRQVAVGITVYGIYSTQLEETSFHEWRGNYTGESEEDISRNLENTVEHSTDQTGLGVGGVIGLLVDVSANFSLGFRVAPGGRIWVSRRESQVFEYLENDAAYYAGDTSAANTQAVVSRRSHKARHVEMPGQGVSVGMAWRPSAEVTVTGQIDYRLESRYEYTALVYETNLAARSGFEVLQGTRERFNVKTESVTDFSAGADWRLGKVYSLTGGLFTDFSQGPYDDKPSSWNKRIDYFGGSLAVGMDKSLTESRFGVNLAWGNAEISHIRWERDAFGRVRPSEVETTVDGHSATEVDLSRRGFDAWLIGIFMSTTLKI